MTKQLKGGYPFYGVPLGIIMLDCKFPRPPGDIGNASSFPFPVHYEILRGVSPAALIQNGEKQAIDTLVQSACRLEKLGVGAIITSCGLLIHFQKILSEAVKIPIASSALLLIPFLDTLIPPQKKIGILCARSSSVTLERIAHVMPDKANRVKIKGMEGSENFDRSIMSQTAPYSLDPETIYKETLIVVKQFLKEEPSLAAILLECTNLAPYSAAIREAIGLPVFDILHLATLLHNGTAGYSFFNPSC